ncbi:MAG: RNA polymerase sigma factor [Mariniblastus sp.]
MSEDDNLRERIRKVVSKRNANQTAGRFDTSDVIQETELQLWRNGLLSFEPEQPADKQAEPSIDQPLLVTIAKRRLFKFLQRHKAKRRDAGLEKASAENVVSNYQSPSEELEQREESELLLQAVNQLDEIEREILFYRFFCELTFAEIQDATKLTKQTLRTKYNRAIANLKTILEQLEGNRRD